MNKFLIIGFLFFSVLGWAEEVPLFATVINVTQNDTLNVRKYPDFHSDIIGSLPLNAYVGVDNCKKTGHARWCKVFHLPQRDYEAFGNDAPSGWVNAKYLKSENIGYVVIDDNPDCDYVLRCHKGKCEVVESYETDEEYEITSIKTKWIDRNRLKASTNFGAMSRDPEASGYCTNGNYIQDFLHQKKLYTLMEKNNNKLLQRVISFVNDLSNIDWVGDKIPQYLHPKKGIIMTWNVRFGGNEDMSFGYSDIKHIEKKKVQKIDWGKTYGKGDDVFMSLYSYVQNLTKPFMDITKVEKLIDLKGFTCDTSSECLGYEIFWIHENSETKEYDWQGLVVILEKYKNQWYVVSLLRDRWII